MLYFAGRLLEFLMHPWVIVACGCICVYLMISVVKGADS